jgi:hypothetical protein
MTVRALWVVVVAMACVVVVGSVASEIRSRLVGRSFRRSFLRRRWGLRSLSTSISSSSRSATVGPAAESSS